MTDQEKQGGRGGFCAPCLFDQLLVFQPLCVCGIGTTGVLLARPAVTSVPSLCHPVLSCSLWFAFHSWDGAQAFVLPQGFGEEIGTLPRAQSRGKPHVTADGATAIFTPGDLELGRERTQGTRDVPAMLFSS